MLLSAHMKTMNVPLTYSSVQDSVDRFVDLHGRKPVILKDMDNTDYDWNARLNEILLSLDPDFPVLAEGERTDYNHLAGPGHDPEILKAAMLHPALYLDMPLLDGAVESTHAFLDAGCPVYFVTTPTLMNPGCVPGKVSDVVRHYGEGMLDRLVITTDKTLVRGDVLFDDKPYIAGAVANPSWVHVMQHRDFNAYVAEHQHRMMGWSDLERVLPGALGLL